MNDISRDGFAIYNNIYSEEEILQIIEAVEKSDRSNETFRESLDLFAIRQFLKEVSTISDLIFNNSLRRLIDQQGSGYFVVKSIYFDKPQLSNWYVASHQDLTISVQDKADVPGFGPWTIKQKQYGVQPPVEYLENIFTLRIHLDAAGVENGALKVRPGSHRRGIIRAKSEEEREEVVCSVERGGVMLMKPLLVHRSSRTTNGQRRRVIHIEFSSLELPNPLLWSERQSLPNA